MLCTLIGAIILFINIHVDMHLYVDIGDASSSLRGSTSSLFGFSLFSSGQGVKLFSFPYVFFVVALFLLLSLSDDARIL